MREKRVEACEKVRDGVFRLNDLGAAEIQAQRNFGQPPRARNRSSLLAIAAAPSLLKPRRLINASSSGKR